MAQKTVKLTTGMLRQIVQEEAAKVKLEAAGELESVEGSKAEETEADELADALEKKIDHYKANKVKEAKLLKQLGSLREAQAVLKKQIIAAKR